MIDSSINEQALIGKILGESEYISSVKNRITPDMITTPIYRLIYCMLIEGAEMGIIIASLKDDFPDVDRILANAMDASINRNFNECVDSVIRQYRYHEVTVDIAGKLSSMDIVEMDQTIQEVSDRLIEMQDKSIDIIKMSMLPGMYQQEYFKPKSKTTFYTGFYDIDRGTGGIDGGDLVIISARPACGKTAFGLNIIQNNPDKFGGYFNLEMTPKQIYEREIAYLGNLSLGFLRRMETVKDIDRRDFEKSNEILSSMDNCELISGSLTLSQIENYVRKQKYDYIIIDYLGLIIPSGHYKGNKYAETTAISSGLKHIAMKYKIPVVVLAQLNRESSKRDDKEPFLSELRDSGAIEQDASVVIMLWEHESNDKRNVKIEKCRNGMRIRTTLIFDGEHMKFSEIPEDNPFTKEENHNERKY